MLNGVGKAEEHNQAAEFARSDWKGSFPGSDPQQQSFQVNRSKTLIKFPASHNRFWNTVTEASAPANRFSESCQR